MNTNYKNYVAGFERLYRGIKGRPSGGLKPVNRRKVLPGAGKVLIFSPHPDDECIVGGLALRLLREGGMKVVNVAVTLGSKLSRRRARLAELKKACRYLGFELVLTKADGLEKVNVETRTKRRGDWTQAVKLIVRILKEQSPKVVFIPHERDAHQTHIGTHFLVMDALKLMPRNFECLVIETEFWGQMAAPNLMVELSVNDLADLVSALALHVGEVKRNAYHLRLPAWMMDNVRLAEAVGGSGCPAPEFTFATNYRVRKWRDGRLVDAWKLERVLSQKMDPISLLS